MVGDRQRIAVLTIGEQELALVIGTPQFIGTLANGESGSLRTTTHAAAALDKAVTIQHRMDGALDRDGDAGKPAEQAFANFASTPTGVLALHVQDEIFHLKGNQFRSRIRGAPRVGRPLQPASLITRKIFVAGLAETPDLSAVLRRR